MKTGLRTKKYASKLIDKGLYGINLENGICQFISRNEHGKIYCRIYNARPKVCRQFPHIHEDVNDCRDIFKNWKRRNVDGVDSVEVELNSKQLRM